MIRKARSSGMEMQSVLFLVSVTALLTLDGCYLFQKQRNNPFFEKPPPSAAFREYQTFNKALIARYKGETESSISLWKEFLKKHPESYEALNNLGETYFYGNWLNESIETFESAYKLKPGDRKIKKNFLGSLWAREERAKANKEYHKALFDLKRMYSLASLDERRKIIREARAVKKLRKEQRALQFPQPRKKSHSKAKERTAEAQTNLTYTQKLIESLDRLSEKMVSKTPRTIEALPTAERLNIRQNPSRLSRVIGHVGKGTALSVLEEKSGWLHVRFSRNKTGWINSKFSRVME
ncbi:MAG: SH3 domain-containing protein [Nitrospinales bacterium]